MTDGFRTIDRGSSAYGEEEIDFVIHGELFGDLDIFDGCAGVIRSERRSVSSGFVQVLRNEQATTDEHVERYH
jgi:hypothetical protein